MVHPDMQEACMDEQGTPKEEIKRKCRMCHRWKWSQVTWEEYKNIIWAHVVGIRRAEACLELNLVRDVQVEKCFCRFVSKGWLGKWGATRLLGWPTMKSLVNKDRAVDNVDLSFSRAFATVAHNILWDKTMKYRLDKWPVRWTENWLSCRTQELWSAGRG